MSKNSKAYRAAVEKVDRNSLYSPLEAAKLAKETSSAKQDATVEVAIRLGVDPRKADQMVRGTVNLPHGTGKTARVAVFAVGDKAEQAQAAGADIVGSDDLIEKIQGGFLDFDAAIATPDQMAKVGRIARVLGPRGLMPNPKTGTVTPDVAKAVADIKGGKINFRVDKQANLHFVIGKASFDEKALAENYGAAIDEVLRLKPSAVEGPLPEEDHRVDDHGPGHPGRPVGHPQLLRVLSLSARAGGASRSRADAKSHQNRLGDAILRLVAGRGPANNAGGLPAALGDAAPQKLPARLGTVDFQRFPIPGDGSCRPARAPEQVGAHRRDQIGAAPTACRAPPRPGRPGRRRGRRGSRRPGRGWRAPPVSRSAAAAGRRPRRW